MKYIFLARRFGALIRELRQEAQLSQEEFADRCELHRTYIGSIERGEKTITIETAYKIAKALGMPLSRIFQRLESSTEEECNTQHDNK
jgi:transcriptional regulator with XRE-family HTH domain